ncbi:ABC transporter permease [Clostridium grantii]|uniref:Putative ABC transport system permease protein n=1 Tax=Clostridium grantii DSM 8605 TaxID=1121316 RepID=A0A1M5WLG8_9CLOT|nr:ABC transporter permease [Clostridium grantii]SHH88450.1 putative ABC transport system permease protein [Clostridium grantii DSM 8605]
MKILESLKMALSSILANKMRSFLTMLGIIIGISSVIAIVSLGTGGQASITGEFEKIGASSVSVMVDTTNASEADYISLKDIDILNEQLEDLKYATPIIGKQGTAVTDTTKLSASITAGNEFYDDINNVTMVDGRFFNANDVLSIKYVAVVDETTANNLFGRTDIVDEYVKIGSNGNEKKFRIIGVQEASQQFGPPNEDRASIYIPITTIEYLYPEDSNIATMTLVSKEKDQAEDMGNSAVSILEARHNNRGKEIYSIQSMLDILDQINNVLGIFTTFITAVAAISLLVGGIGVMNIMLVSVTERTREIGIRKAIGATTNNILFQFLTESAIISLIGGIIGMIIGIGGANIIGGFVDIVPEVSATVVIGTILFSSAIGIFFGIYPARKAANLKPIDALRYE